MFLVSDTIVKRHAKIRSFIKKDPAIAVILAAADFEWTVRRAILALGRSPTKHIREKVLANCTGLEKYKNAWKEEVKPRLNSDLAIVVPNWFVFSKQAYPLRHRLIHGVVGTTGHDYAKEKIDTILGASKAVVDYSLSKSEPLYGRKIVRRKSRN